MFELLSPTLTDFDDDPDTQPTEEMPLHEVLALCADRRHEIARVEAPTEEISLVAARRVRR